MQVVEECQSKYKTPYNSLEETYRAQSGMYIFYFVFIPDNRDELSFIFIPILGFKFELK